MPSRRSTDQFTPESAPRELREYRERTWYNQQLILFQITRMNGTQQDHSKRIMEIESTVKGGKMVLATLGGLGGLGAGALVFGKKLMAWVGQWVS